MKIEEITEKTKTEVTTMLSEDMTAEENLAFGDSCFVDENFEQASNAYAAALSVLREDHPQAAAMKIRILSHRSAAFYRMRRFEDAMDDAEDALEILNSANGKGVVGLRPGESESVHKRCGVAAINLQHFEEAKAMFEKAQQLAMLNRGDDKTYKSYIKQCDYNLKPKDNMPSPMMATDPHAPAPASAAAKAPPSSEKPVETSKPATAALKKGFMNKPGASKNGSKPQKSKSDNKPKKSESSSKKMPVSAMPKYQYYQNDKFVTISLLESKVKEEDLNVDFQPQHLTVRLMKNGTNHTVICGNLYSEVDVEKCKTVFKAEKVLVKLRKANEGFEWHELIAKKALSEPAGGETKHDDQGNEVQPTGAADPSNATSEEEKAAPPVIPTVDTSKPRPYASHRDWDKIERELAEQEKAEQPEGDAAMNQLFQTIYASADEDTRRAMVKSYQTSGGTVLSTNWDEVKEKDYENERSAPKGMEWKNWEGDKLPTKDDD